MSDSEEDKKGVGRPKSEYPTKPIRVPEVLIPTIENLVEAFKSIKKEDLK